MVRFSTQHECKHNQDFKCTQMSDSSYAFYCVGLCGFTMNFNPELYPEGVAFGKPDPNINWRDQIKLVPSLK